MSLIEKIRKTLLTRAETMAFEEERNQTEVYDDLSKKLDILCRKMDYFSSSMRMSDDELLITVSGACSNWYELSKKLHGDILLLNKRINDLESMLLRLNANIEGFKQPNHGTD